MRDANRIAAAVLLASAGADITAEVLGMPEPEEWLVRSRRVVRASGNYWSLLAPPEVMAAAVARLEALRTAEDVAEAAAAAASVSVAEGASAEVVRAAADAIVSEAEEAFAALAGEARDDALALVRASMLEMLAAREAEAARARARTHARNPDDDSAYGDRWLAARAMHLSASWRHVAAWQARPRALAAAAINAAARRQRQILKGYIP